jgi:tRNA-dihydrouridine synthase B
MLFLRLNYKFPALFTIGHIEFADYPLFLAPMEDITDPSFRYMCKKFGADMVYTEFISSDGLIRDGKKSVQKLDINEAERPVGIQIYGHILDSMVDATRIAEEARPDLIDINYGCPVRKIAHRGAGAGMLNNIPYMVEMTRAIVKTSKLPVTVKTRLGWDDEHKEIVDIALRLQDEGIKAITIHGRTRAQLYRGKADWTLIGEVKNHPSIHIPVIGNGDVDRPEVARQLFDRYQVDAIMIGRAAIGMPWIFRDIRHYLKTGEKLAAPSVEERLSWALEHFEKSIQYKGERVGVLEMRRHFSNYFKGLPHFKETRLRLLTAMDIGLIYKILEEISTRYTGFEFPAADQAPFLEG